MRDFSIVCSCVATHLEGGIQAVRLQLIGAEDAEGGGVAHHDLTQEPACGDGTGEKKQKSEGLVHPCTKRKRNRKREKHSRRNSPICWVLDPRWGAQ